MDRFALPKCPSCRANLPDPNPDTCACGFDIKESLEFIAPYLLPKPGALVLPIRTMRRMSKKDRAEVTQAIERARKSNT